MDKREFERYSIKDYSALKIMILDAEKRYEAGNEDISKGGIGFNVEKSFEAKQGDKIVLSFSFSEKFIVKLIAVIRHIGDNYIGAQFDGVNLVGAQFEEENQILTNVIDAFVTTLKAETSK